jgi:hypothetical protein
MSFSPPTASDQRKVDLAEIRKAFADSDINVNKLAARMGCNDMRVRRLLGLSPEYRARSQRYRSHEPYYLFQCSVPVALRLIAALDLDPVDFGL